MPAKGQKGKGPRRDPETGRICRVIGCENEANRPGSALGLCYTHYGVWLKNGKKEDPPVMRQPKPPEELPAISLPVRANGVGYHPKKEIDIGLVERAAQMGCTNGEIVALLDVSMNCFLDRLKDDPALKNALDWGRDTGRATLRRMQWAAAETGNPTMLIWLGKQMLGQMDKIENSGTVDNRLKVIVEFVGDAAPAIEHDKPKQEQRFTPRLVEGVEWKG